MVQKKEDDAPKRRGRPRAYDPKTALARAAETFWKAGYAGTSLDDLAAATGMNRPSLYAAFGDKRELYLKTLEHYRDEYRALAREALADDPTLRVFLKRFYDTALEHLSRRRRRPARLLFDRHRRDRRGGRSGRARLPRRQHAQHRRVPEEPDRQGKERGEIAHDADTDGARLSRKRHHAHDRDPRARGPSAQGTRRDRRCGDRRDLPLIALGRRAPRSHVNTLHMSWSKGPRGYHHGNLKEALIRAALELIAEKGPAGFTFAEAARWAGVSPAAPYRHFRDRDELLADVARRGFEQFAAALEAAWDGGRPDPMTAFERIGKAYLAFARTEPSYYSAMFEAGVPLEASPELTAAGDRAFAVIRAASERLIEQMPPGKRPPALMMALHVWSLSHGIASLFGRGDAGRRKLPMSAEELLEAGVLVYLRGLGLGPPTSS